MKRLYLAGFDVFRVDAVAHGEMLKALCQQYGFEGTYPLDNTFSELIPHTPREALARHICEANLALIAQADAVVANLNPFRGHEPDSGTAFEVGYARALGKPIWAYTEQTRPLLEQIESTERHGRHFDSQGYEVEDFGLCMNLMLACSVTIVQGDARQCLQTMRFGERPS